MKTYITNGTGSVGFLVGGDRVNVVIGYFSNGLALPNLMVTIS